MIVIILLAFDTFKERKEFFSSKNINNLYEWITYLWRKKVIYIIFLRVLLFVRMRCDGVVERKTKYEIHMNESKVESLGRKRWSSTFPMYAYIKNYVQCFP